jgi:hypothetical protein
MSVWSAPITAVGGAKPTITVKPTSAADVGAAATEYTGLSTAAGTAALDVQAHATGTTSGAATVSRARLRPLPRRANSPSASSPRFLDHGPFPAYGAGNGP